jgi:hypothetical protein
VRVAAALAGRVPELAALTATGCDVRRVHIKKEVLRAFYRVEIESVDGVPAHTVDLWADVVPPGWAEPEAAGDDGSFDSTGWRCWVPELHLDFAAAVPGDPALPALPVLSDRDPARALLERAIRSGSPRYADLQIEACLPRIARYTPGSRCAIVYELSYPPGSASDGWPETVVAKVHRGDKGRRAYESMRALWQSDLRQSRHVLIAEPLGYLSDEKVLVQAGIANNGTFQALLQSSLETRAPGAIESVGTYIDEAAVALAELHACDARPRHIVTVADEIADVRALLARLGDVVPELAGAETTLMASLEALARAEPADSPRPAHGSFRPAQLLLTDDVIALIDFDSFCLGEPAMDVARFRAILKDVALKTLARSDHPTADDLPSPEHLRLVDELSGRFLERYLAAAPQISRSRVALWEALDLMTLVLHGWTKLKLKRLGARLALLRRHLRLHGLHA